KQGFCYVFDRLTGKPIWPIDEKPVPQSTVPGEKTSPTQPFPTKPAPFDRQGVTENDVIDFTPELRKQALAVLEKYNYGPLFTPPSFQKPTIELPGIAGGASWSGAACDPETGICYVSSVTLPYVATLTKISVPNTDYYGKMTPVETMQGVPLWKPPYGRITAIDLNTGDHRWMTPAGDLAQSNPVLRQLGLRGLGRAARGHLLLTKTLLIVGQEGGTHREGGSPEEVPDFEIRDPKLSAYDKETGTVVGALVVRALLQRASHGSPRHQAVRRDRQINNGKGSTRLVARAGPGTAQPGREGSTIFPEEYYPLIRVSSSLRSDETSLAVSIFGVCQRLPLITGDFAQDWVACVKAISRHLSTSTLLAVAGYAYIGV